MHNLSQQIGHHLQHDALHIQKHRKPLARLLKATLIEGEIPRGKVSAVTGAKSSSTQEVIKHGVAERLLTSLGPKKPLRLAFPAKVLETYFPKLFLDLPVE